MSSPVTRPVRDCPHNGLHKHGTLQGYKEDRCGCDACRRAISLSRNKRMLAIYSGTWEPWADPEPVRKHIEALRAHGVSLKRIMEAAGVSGSVVNRLLYEVQGDPRTRRMKPANAAALLALTLENVGGPRYVDGTGTARRVQALVAIGWGQAELGRRIGKSTQLVNQLTTPSPLEPASRDRIIALFDELWDKTPPRNTQQQREAYTKAINCARRHDWLPPLAWDEDSIDDPAAKPYRPRKKEQRIGLDEIAIEEACIGRKVALTIAERAEAVRRLTQRGYTAKAASQYLGTTERLVVRHRAKAATRGVAA